MSSPPLNPDVKAFSCRLSPPPAQASAATPKPADAGRDDAPPATQPKELEQRRSQRAPYVVVGSSASLPPQQAKAATGDSATPLWGMWEWWAEIPPRAPRTMSKAAAAQFSSQQQNATWLDAVKSVALFDTVEGFWGVMDNVVGPSGLPIGGNFYVFRHHIAPMWEHEANRRGGKWILAFGPDQAVEADKCWLALAIAVIGEQLPGNEEEVCGVVASRRRSGFKLSVWTRNASDVSAQKGIGFFLKVLLGLGKPGTQFAGMTLQYLEHSAVLSAAAKIAGSPTGSSPPATPEALASPAAASPPLPKILYSL